MEITNKIKNRLKSAQNTPRVTRKTCVLHEINLTRLKSANKTARSVR